MFRDPNGLGWFLTAPDITQLMANAVRGHLDCPEPDAVLNIETHLFNVTLQAETCDYNLDVGKELWLNKGRWSRLMKEYVPIEPLNRFTSQACEILAGDARLGATANMMFRDPDRFDKKHRWGGCLMGATFRGDNDKSGPAILTFYSRTTYMGYMALLDAAIANRTAAQIAKAAGLSLADISFRWHLSSQQLHCFKTLPYVYSQPDLLKQVESLEKRRTLLKSDSIPPTWRNLGAWYCKVVDAWAKFKNCDKMLASEKYGPWKRIKRRWLEHEGHLNKHVPPSLMVNELDFEKCI